MDKIIGELKNHYIICGLGRVGRNVAQVFDSSGTSYVVIDRKREMRNDNELMAESWGSCWVRHSSLQNSG